VADVIVGFDLDYTWVTLDKYSVLFLLNTRQLGPTIDQFMEPIYPPHKYPPSQRYDSQRHSSYQQNKITFEIVRVHMLALFCPAKSFEGSDFLEFGPANIPTGKPPAKNPTTLEVVKKKDSSTEG
jgi:hypothetical protein